MVDQCILDIGMKIQCKGTGLGGVRWSHLPQGRDNERARLKV